MQRWTRVGLFAAVAVGVVIAVQLFRTYRPANQLILLVPANEYEVDNTDVHDKASSGTDGSLAAQDKGHVETEGKVVEHSNVVEGDNSHTNGNKPPPDIPSDTHATVGPPLQRKHNERQQEVVKMFKHAWMGYTKYAWGRDELLPISKSGSSSFNMGLTIIDSLDTMWLMGLTEEFRRAREWVAHSLNFAGMHKEVSVFETNIRVLGGLLAAYHLSNDHIFLQRAVELGERLLPVFKTPTGIPYGSVVLNQGYLKKTSRVACVAELGTLQLEFRDLSHSTGDKQYQAAVDRALSVFQSHLSNGIAPQEAYIDTGVPKHTQLTVGARTDSYYEYLLKQWIQSGKTEDQIKGWYTKSANAIITKFVKYSQPHHWAYLAQLPSPVSSSFSPKMDHLACFAPGMLALGYLHGFPESHLNVAKNLTHTCYELYHQSPCGLSPDVVVFNTNKHSMVDFHSVMSANIQRPETVESLFVLYRVTRDPVYREWGWEILQAFKKHSKVESGGFTTLQNVNTPHPRQNNKMESFFLAETLKYLFLLFTDDEDILPLDKWVFNTEAHPLPVWNT